MKAKPGLPERVRSNAGLGLCRRCCGHGISFKEQLSILVDSGGELLLKLLVIGKKIHVHVHIEVNLGLKRRCHYALLTGDIDNWLAQRLRVAGFKVTGRSLASKIGDDELRATDLRLYSLTRSSRGTSLSIRIATQRCFPKARSTATNRLLNSS